MPKAQTGEPLFSLAFSAEAVLPSTVVFPTLQAKCFEEDSSGRSLLENVDLLEEYRAKAHLWTLAYKKVVVRLYNQRGKFALNWEGPYRVISIVQDNTYTLATIKGTTLLRTWHILNLRKFYT
ncbi:hypothetical protein BHE74_00007247 [Ensete ventricosum]|nr:hypothetical protein BHE74_00007247 [Ensete ventricosum]